MVWILLACQGMFAGQRVQRNSPSVHNPAQIIEEEDQRAVY